MSAVEGNADEGTALFMPLTYVNKEKASQQTVAQKKPD
jgi:hypothetical protein